MMRFTVLRFHDSTFLGESPPPAPRVCFGREELVEKVIRFAENLEPIATGGKGPNNQWAHAEYIENPVNM